MGKEISTEIRDHYATYISIISEKKHINERKIIVNRIKKNNVNYLEKINQIFHPEHTSYLIDLYTTVKIINNKYFSFNLRCIKIYLKPFFGYHSAGPAHRNYDNENIPLSEQRIEAPHFHRYNENGLSIAYRPDKLNDQNEATALEDIVLCGIYFCQEAKINYQQTEFPEVVIDKGNLLFDYNDENPNTNIQFT
jgi:hypothetical protein